MTQYRNSAPLFLALTLVSAGCRSTKEEPPPPPAAQPAPPPPVAPPVPAAEPSAAPQKPAFGRLPPEGIIVNQWAVGGQCNIDFINGPVKSNKPSPVTAGASVKVIGWAYDDKASKLPDTMAVRIASKDGEYYGTVTKGIKRQDVSAARHLDENLMGSGFELTFDSSLIDRGDYSLSLVMKSGDKAYICDNGRKITVTQ